MGGEFQDFEHKSLAPLTGKVLRKHISGQESIGIYPLLKDNTSWFLAVDFDREKWLKESRQFIQACEDYNLSAYLERSLSGNGGHFQILLTTGQYFGEGVDVKHFDSLFLVYPFAFKGKLIQYLGRIVRTNEIPVLYDYRDRKINYFEKQFRKRNKFYDEIRKANQVSLDL